MSEIPQDAVVAHLEKLTDIVNAYIREKIGVPLPFVLSIESASAVSYLSNLRPEQGEVLLTHVLDNLRKMQGKDPRSESLPATLH